jgi:23S rRNA (cytosine1962-C5)-methyltransferase
VTLPASAAPGDVVPLHDERGPVAVVMVEPGSPIAARVLALWPDGAPAPTLDATWVRARASSAARMRRRDPLLAGCDGIRWIHGENDRLPGLVIDGYGDVLVVVYDGAAAEAFWSPRLGEVLAGLAAEGVATGSIWVRPSRRNQGVQRPGFELGASPPALIEIHEDEARFAVDVRHGQKTGFFLDQRRNRQLVRELAAGASVLNVFAYSGGFSVHAALGGARAVTTVDIAAEAIRAAEDNFRRSGVEPAGHEFVAGDAFAFFDQALAAGRRWDLVITDPPSFAPSEAARGKGLAAYRRLAIAALRVVAPGGQLAFASCSSHITEADLMDALAQAAVALGRPLRIRATLGGASDHPTLPAFPEGRYLKFILCDAP